VAAWQASKRHEVTGYFSGVQRNLVLAEAEPRLAALSQALPANDDAANPSNMAAAPVTDCDRLAADPEDK
jgi:hypothetical protein